MDSYSKATKAAPWNSVRLTAFHADFTRLSHLNWDWPRSQCSVATCGWWAPYWTVWVSETFVTHRVCGPKVSSISGIWELERHADSQAPCLTYWIRICIWHYLRGFCAPKLREGVLNDLSSNVKISCSSDSLWMQLISFADMRNRGPHGQKWMQLVHAMATWPVSL